MRLKKIGILVTTMLLAASTAYAAVNEPSYDRATGVVEISGTGVSDGDTIRMIVLRPDADYDRLKTVDQTFFTSCIHIAEMTASGESYTFPSFEIPEDASPGLYKIIVAEGSNIDNTKSIDYATISQTLDFIKDATDAEEVERYIEKYNTEVYGLQTGENTDYSRLDTTRKEAVLNGLRNVAYADVTALQTKFNENVAAAIEAYRTEAFAAVSNKSTATEISNAIDAYNSVYGIDRSEPLFTALDDDGKNAVYAKMTSEVYSSDAQIQKAFKQKTILLYIQKGPYGKISGYINEYNSILNLDLTKYSADNSGLLKSIVGKECKNVSDLQSLIDNYTPISTPPGNAVDNSISNKGYKPSIGAPSTATPTPSDKTIFSDVSKEHWANESIEELYKRNIISGRDNGSFAPNDSVTRSEAIKMIVLAIDIKSISDAQVNFDDISEDAWEYDYVRRAIEAGIVNGIDDKMFGGNRNITRQDLCVMIYRAMVNAGYEIASGTAEFTDEDQISDYAVDAIDALTAQNIISGMDDGSFAPLETATRAQTAKIIYGVIK